MFNQMSHYVMGSTPIWSQLIDRFGWVDKLNAQGYREDAKLTPSVRIKALLINILTDRAALYRVEEFFWPPTMKGLPFYGTVEDGILVDPKWNGQMIPKLREALEQAVPQHKPIYIADAAAVNEDNLQAFAAHRMSFISRLPSTYKLYVSLKEAAWSKQEAWQDIGVLAEDADGSSYRLQAFRRELGGRTYRFLVVCSTSLEAVKAKKLEDVILREQAKWSKAAEKASSETYACRKDAQRAVAAFEQAHTGGLHTVRTTVVEEIQHAKRSGRSRPRKDEPAPEGQRVYRLTIEIVAPSEEAQAHFLHLELAFVLVTDIRDDQRLPDAQVLRLYKEQHEVEGRFRFLKRPYFVGPIYLHSPRRVEAFAYVMLLALLLYSAFEHVIRTKMKDQQEPLILPGKRKSYKPTGSSVMDMFEVVLTSAVKIGGQWHRGITSRPYPERDRVLAFFGWVTGIYTQPSSLA